MYGLGYAVIQQLPSGSDCPGSQLVSLHVIYQYIVRIYCFTHVFFVLSLSEPDMKNTRHEALCYVTIVLLACLAAFFPHNDIHSAVFCTLNPGQGSCSASIQTSLTFYC
jgi:hypothetical protein